MIRHSTATRTLERFRTLSRVRRHGRIATWRRLILSSIHSPLPGLVGTGGRAVRGFLFRPVRNLSAAAEARALSTGVHSRTKPDRTVLLWPIAMERSVTLRPVDHLEVTILVDNSIDLLLASSNRVKRAPMVPDWSEREQLIAEHGYSALLTIRENGTSRRVLYDAGLGKDTLLHNMRVLGLSTKDLDSIVLSHGHADHHGGLLGMVQAVGKRNLPLVLHPDAWRVRQAKFGPGILGNLPPPDRKRLEAADVQFLEKKGPSLLVGDGVLVTGQVERTTEFEKGFPVQRWLNHDGRWEPDPWTWDDQPIVANVKGAGLVVVSGCSHAGIINILRHARKATGVDRIAGVIGGLHLTGNIFEPVIPPTLAELAKIHPEVIVPGHCTGWKAMHEIARLMPEAFVQTAVGTTVHFG